MGREKQPVGSHNSNWRRFVIFTEFWGKTQIRNLKRKQHITFVFWSVSSQSCVDLSIHIWSIYLWSYFAPFHCSRRKWQCLKIKSKRVPLKVQNSRCHQYLKMYQCNWYIVNSLLKTNCAVLLCIPRVNQFGQTSSAPLSNIEKDIFSVSQVSFPSLLSQKKHLALGRIFFLSFSHHTCTIKCENLQIFTVTANCWAVSTSLT